MATTSERLELDAWRVVAGGRALKDVLTALARLLGEAREPDVVWAEPSEELPWASAPRGAVIVADDTRYLALGTILGRVAALALAIAPESRVDDAALSAVSAPVAVAVERDSWARRLDRVTQAAMADRTALLRRLEREDIAEVVGGDAGLRDVMRLVDQVSATATPVLLLGETGSGKEVVSRAIHGRSTRASGPIIRVNCAAIPPELVDAELFGHERGSFTGASATRKGWFERADGGTLFLDEVGDLPPHAQVRLLRVLQDGTLDRIGGQRTLKVDVRLVTATHRDLRAMVSSGAFREDLWYRISTFVIKIPPLRKRLQDIAPLAEHFARRAGVRLAGMPLEPSAADVARLMAYRWPGNVRELASVIERAAILGSGRRLEVAAALGDVVGDHARPPSMPPPPDEIDTLDRAMARHIESALARTRGRIEGRDGAATLLGINPHTLRARMRKLGIDWPAFRARDVPS